MLEAARGHQPWARKAPAGPDHSVETRNAKRRIAAGRKGRADLRAPKRKKLKRFQNGKSNRGVPFSLSPEPKMTFMRQSYCFVATPNAADKGRRPPAPRIPNQDGFPFWESLLRLGSISPFQAQKRPRPQTSAAKLSHLRGYWLAGYRQQPRSGEAWEMDRKLRTKQGAKGSLVSPEARFIVFEGGQTGPPGRPAKGPSGL